MIAAPVAPRHWEQSYRGISVPVGFNGTVWLLQCDGCGSLVGDRDRHDEWHRVTRSVVSEGRTSE